MSIAAAVCYIPACFKFGAWTSWGLHRRDEACRSRENHTF